jgi:hypothetical protein
MASAPAMMGVVRLGIASNCLQEAQREGTDTRRLERRAATLHKIKTAAFDVIGAPVDVLLRALGGTGIDLYAIATRPK